MQPPSDKVCPFHKKWMSKVCLSCPLWVNLKGRNPQSGEIVDKWGCSFSFMPLLMVENSQQSRQTAAAVESFRNLVMERRNIVAMEKRLEKLGYSDGEN